MILTVQLNFPLQSLVLLVFNWALLFQKIKEETWQLFEYESHSNRARIPIGILTPKLRPNTCKM